MSEELEEYKEGLLGIAHGYEFWSNTPLSDKEKEIVKYFVEQAERVQDLEEFVSSIEWQTKTLKKRQGKINRLNEQNKRYRESVTNIIDYIETTEDDTSRQLHKIHIILDRLSNGNSQ